MDVITNDIFASVSLGWALFLVLLIAFITGLLLGKIYTSNQVDNMVENANQRGNDYKQLYEKEAEAHNRTLALFENVLKPVGESTTKIMQSLTRLSADETETMR